jgi:membrane associated rhomboid family serine protease
MLYLWVFGDNIEDSMGHLKYLVFYIACGLGAAVAQVAVAPASALPMVGASGAIAGVLGAYLVLYPTNQVLTLVFLVIFIRVMYLPAMVLLGLWFIIQIFSALNDGGAGVAWYAHIGGFLVGVLLVSIFASKDRGRPPRRRRKLHVVH